MSNGQKTKTNKQMLHDQEIKIKELSAKITSTRHWLTAFIIVNIITWVVR